MIKIGQEVFRITSLFCLRRRYSVKTSLIFIQNFVNYSFVCIYWTVHCPRIHYDSFENYWIVFSKYKKLMVSLPFIFCWRKHCFLMIIKNNFFLFDCHKLVKNNPINTKMSQDLFEHTMNISYPFLFEKTGNVSKNITWKVFKRVISENINIIAF